MDPTSFAIGVVGLTSIVTTCIDTFRIIRSIRAYGHDAEIIILKLGIERDLFIQWAYNAGLLQKHYVKANLFNPKRDKLIHDVLTKIKQLLLEAEDLARKYGMLDAEHMPSAFSCEKERKWCSCDRHEGRHRHRDDEYRSTASLSQSPTKVSLSRKFMWTIHAKDEFEGLIEQLHYFIERLDQMVKSVDQRRTMMKDLRGLGADFSKLDLLDDGKDDWSDMMTVFGDDTDESKKGERQKSKDIRRHHRHESHSRSEVSSSSQGSGSSSRSKGSGHNADRKDDGRREWHSRQSARYDAPPPYTSSVSKATSSSGKSSRSTFSDMVDDVVGGRSKGRSEFY